MEGKLPLHLGGELLVPLDADAAAASAGKLFGKVNFLWNVSWMCLSPHLPNVHVLDAADIELDADKGSPTDSCKGLLRFLGNAWRSRTAGYSTEVVRAWPENCGNRGAHWRFRRGCGPDISLGLGLLLGSKTEAPKRVSRRQMQIGA